MGNASAECADCGEWFTTDSATVALILAFGERPRCPDCEADAADGDGENYRLTRRSKEGWVLRREKPSRTGYYRRLSARFGGVVAVRTGPGPRLPASPFGVAVEQDESGDEEPPITPDTFAVEATGQASLADYTRHSGSVEATPTPVVEPIDAPEREVVP